MKTNEIWLVNITSPFRTKKLERRAPLALMYLSGALKQKGFHPRIWDLQEKDVEQFLREASKTPLLFVAISSTFGVWAPLSAWVARKLKKICPQVPIIVGGINVSVCSEPYVKEPSFDFIAIGEGEITIQEFANAVSNGEGFEKIPGLTFHKDGKPFHTSPRLAEGNIDKFDIDFYSVDMNLYINTLNDGTRLLNSYQTSRGCPFNCAFCYNSAFNKRRWRAHSLEYIIKDMEFLKSRYNFSAITLTDDHFFANRKWAFRVMEKLYEMGIILVNADARVHDLNNEFFEKISKFECKSVFFGFESENPRILKLMHKETAPDMIEKALDTARSYPNIDINTQVILGVPTHSWQEITDTLRYMIEKLEQTKNFICTAVLFIPLPGSEFYHMVRDKGFSGYHQLDDFKKIGISLKHGYTFQMEWLDIPESKKKRLRRIHHVTVHFHKILFVKRRFRGLIWLVNELFYQICKYRIMNLRTGFLLEATIYNIFVDGFKFYIKKIKCINKSS